MKKRSSKPGRGKKATTSPTAATGAKTKTKATRKAKVARVATVAKQGQRRAKPKGKSAGKMSGLDAAAKVLGEANKPMAVRQIVETALAKKYWQSGGQTPYATIYSAIIREIANKKKESRFRKTERGRFALKKK